ncbi:MAG: transposase, partial [Candidatus Sumerlaeia bacterium]|nr:transposase [Candidatus Sumerlaeia bacterium]
VVPPIRRGGKLKHPQRIDQEELYFQAMIDGIYGQSWKVETVISVIKRVFGEEIRSRKEHKKDI